MAIVFALMSSVLVSRFFELQIINGADAQSDYILKVVKEKDLDSTRGNIYDRNGKLLAYNDMAYCITISDNEVYKNNTIRNMSINTSVLKLLHAMDANGDNIDNDFKISYDPVTGYSYNVTSETRKLRFIADVFGKANVNELGFDKKLGYDTSTATAQNVMDYIYNNKYHIFDEPDKYEYPEFTEYDRYRIAVVRNAMSKYNFQRYLSATIATDVSEKTVAYVYEHNQELSGIDVSENTVRKYTDSKYFAHIIGYTGLIDEDEYVSLSQDSDEYTLHDTVGKSGLEQKLDTDLKGSKGEETVIVDNLGRELEVLNRTEPQAGNNLYISIDKDLQIATYNLLEQEIAGILYSKIVDSKQYESNSSSDIHITIDDAYYALINNNVIDIEHFSDQSASETEKRIYETFESRKEEVVNEIYYELTRDDPTVYSDLSKELQLYMSTINEMLMNNEIIIKKSINWNDQTYIAWKNDKISFSEYLHHVINMQWFDITKLDSESLYSDTDEIYDLIVDYIISEIKNDKKFDTKIYRYLIYNNGISLKDLGIILYDQQIIDYDDEILSELSNGEISPFEFLLERIKKIEITPAQFALDPCTGSCVIADVKTGELLACVTYPGYDNNKLANTVDSKYFNSLMNDLSSPFYNNATQQKTAPGSTFKMVTATAGLTESVITTETKIKDLGVFEKVQNGPKCWIYPNSTHGDIDVSEALRDSCNYFFYEVGWRLSSGDTNYSERVGIEKLTKYASMYGLDDTTGIEISESTPEIATEYPITAAIGQSNHNFTTIALSRYVTAVANRGSVYNYTLLSKLTDVNGNTIRTYSPSIKYKMTEISDSTWNAIARGNRMVCESLSSFDDFGDFEVSGKTGTAQQVKNRPNHALFVGYAPSGNPEISIATRIAYGYTSHNASDVSAEILKYYFNLESDKSLLDGIAAEVGNNTNTFTD